MDFMYLQIIISELFDVVFKEGELSKRFPGIELRDKSEQQAMSKYI